MAKSRKTIRDEYCVWLYLKKQTKLAAGAYSKLYHKRAWAGKGV